MRLSRAFAAVGLLAALSASSASAQRRDTGFDLVRLDASARAAALAGAPGALAGDDPTAVFYNPALLTDDMSGAVSVGYLNHVSDVSAGTILYARRVPPLDGLTLAASVRYLSYGDFDRTAADGTADGTFSAGETAVTLSAAREVAPRVRVGVNLHALTARIDDARAVALTGDAGVTYDVPSQRLVVGASLHHVGTALSSLGAERDRLPTDLRVTVSKRLQYLPLTVSIAGYDLQGIEGAASDSSAVRRALDHVAAGGELRLGRALALRAGFNPRRADDLRSGSRLDLAGVSMGFGLALSRFALDYAYNGWSQYGGLHQFGLRTRL